MTARIFLIFMALVSIAPTARPANLAAFAVAVAHVESILPVEAATVVAIAFVETGGSFKPALVSRRGACGITQVMPKWSSFTCEQMSTPFGGVLAGVVSWEYWAGRARIYSVAEHYNGGNRPGFAATIYGREWERARERFLVALDSLNRWPLRWQGGRYFPIPPAD